MQKSLLYKTMIVIGLALVICIPLHMIQSTIAERMLFRNEAVRSIGADSVYEQTLIGPLLIIPYTDEYEDQEVIPDTRPVQNRTVQRKLYKRLIVFPDEVRFKGKVDTDHRYRGIHKVLVYSSQQTVSGNFSLPGKDALSPERPESRLTLGQPFVALSISDVRGIRNAPHLSWNGKPFEFQQGSGLQAFRNGLHAPLERMTLDAPQKIAFSFELGLDGIERIRFAPVARNSEVTLVSDWPHPQFGGRFLPAPRERRIDANGFSATWRISALATDTQQQLSNVENQAAPQLRAEQLDLFGVGFIEPINIYSQADRAIKYGLLFVALTFAAFFLFELLKRLPIHPVQYTLVGLALALFFLLLVSLSEHLQFAQSYLIASSACVLLIGFYLAHVLRSRSGGFGFALGLTLLYAVLYGLLRSENNALVLGSILLFAVLSAVMIATRKVDWYRIGGPGQSAAAAPASPRAAEPERPMNQ